MHGSTYRNENPPFGSLGVDTTTNVASESRTAASPSVVAESLPSHSRISSSKPGSVTGGKPFLIASTLPLSVSTPVTRKPRAPNDAPHGAPSFPNPITEIDFSMRLPSETWPSQQNSQPSIFQLCKIRSYLITGGQSGPGISYRPRSKTFLALYQKKRTFGTRPSVASSRSSLSMIQPNFSALSSALAISSHRPLNRVACCKLSESPCSRKPPISESTVYSCACRKKRAHSSKSLAYRHAASTCPPALSHKLRRQNVASC